MTVNFWYGFLLWVPPVIASLLFLRSLKDEENQTLTAQKVKSRLIFYIVVVFVSWVATSLLRYWLYKDHPIAQHFLPPKGQLYYQIIFGRLLVKIAYDALVALGVGSGLWLLQKTSARKWLDTIDIYLFVFGTLAAGWEFALYFILTTFIGLLLDGLSDLVQKQRPRYYFLTQPLLVAGIIWSIIAGYQYIYVLNIYS